MLEKYISPVSASFYDKNILLTFLKIEVKFVDNFFEKHFIDMSFRMLFHSHCIEKIGCLVEK